jgi:hypothetical protein
MFLVKLSFKGRNHPPAMIVVIRDKGIKACVASDHKYVIMCKKFVLKIAIIDDRRQNQNKHHNHK